MLVTMTIAYVLPAVYQRVPIFSPVIVAPDLCYHRYTPQARLLQRCRQLFCLGHPRAVIACYSHQCNTICSRALRLAGSVSVCEVRWMVLITCLTAMLDDACPQ